MSTWKTKLSAGLLWVLGLPYILYGVSNLLYMTVWDKPGYQRGEQFAIIWVIFAVIVVIILAAVSFALLRKSKTAYILVLLGVPYNLLTSIQSLLAYQSPSQIFYFLIGVTAITLLVFDWKSFFRKTEKVGEAGVITPAQTPAERRNFELNTPTVVALILIIGGLFWSLQYREQKNQQQISKEQNREGIHINQLNLSRSTFLNFPFRNVGDIQLNGTQLIIAGQGGFSTGLPSEPLRQQTNFVKSTNGSVNEHKIVLASDGKLRFYNNYVLHDETGKILGNIDATPGFQDVRQVDADGDGMADFFVVKDGNPYLFKGTFKKGVSIDGRIMGENEYQQYYPIFLYDKIVEYPAGSGTKYYQKVTAYNGMRQLELYKLGTRELMYKLPAGTNPGGEYADDTYTDMAVINFDNQPFTAILSGGYLFDPLSKLYIYNQQGVEVYQEVLKEHCGALSSVIVQTKPILLLGCSNVVYGLTTE